MDFGLTSQYFVLYIADITKHSYDSFCSCAPSIKYNLYSTYCCVTLGTGGGYQENCGEARPRWRSAMRCLNLIPLTDPSRAYSSLTDVLTSNGKSDLVEYMKKFWVSNDESSEKFWEVRFLANLCRCLTY